MKEASWILPTALLVAACGQQRTTQSSQPPSQPPVPAASVPQLKSDVPSVGEEGYAAILSLIEKRWEYTGGEASLDERGVEELIRRNYVDRDGYRAVTVTPSGANQAQTVTILAHTKDKFEDAFSFVIQRNGAITYDCLSSDCNHYAAQARSAVQELLVEARQPSAPRRGKRPFKDVKRLA